MQTCSCLNGTATGIGTTGGEAEREREREVARGLHPAVSRTATAGVTIAPVEMSEMADTTDGQGLQTGRRHLSRPDPRAALLKIDKVANLCARPSTTEYYWFVLPVNGAPLRRRYSGRDRDVQGGYSYDRRFDDGRRDSARDRYGFIVGSRVHGCVYFGTRPCRPRLRLARVEEWSES
jgi:hypothetical protein